MTSEEEQGSLFVGIPGSGAALYQLGLTLSALSLSPFTFELCCLLIGGSETKEEGKDSHHARWQWSRKAHTSDHNEKGLWSKGLAQILDTKIPSDKINAVIILKVWAVGSATKTQFGRTWNFSLVQLSRHGYLNPFLRL